MGAKVKLVIHLYCFFQTDAIDNGSERSIRPKTQAIEPLRIILITLIYCKLKKKNNNTNNRVIAVNFDLNKIEIIK